jgi:hypothetical protein
MTRWINLYMRKRIHTRFVLVPPTERKVVNCNIPLTALLRPCAIKFNEGLRGLKLLPYKKQYAAKVLELLNV